MSSPHPDPDLARDGGELGEAGAASAATKWPRWRISMLAGALVLLVAAIVDAAVDGLPRFLYVAVFFGGYFLLAYGFFLAMNARRGTPDKKRKE